MSEEILYEPHYPMKAACCKELQTISEKAQEGQFWRELILGHPKLPSIRLTLEYFNLTTTQPQPQFKHKTPFQIPEQESSWERINLLSEVTKVETGFSHGNSELEIILSPLELISSLEQFPAIVGSLHKNMCTHLQFVHFTWLVFY